MNYKFGKLILTAEILKNIKKIIFDLDGVLTNENAYFITLRLTLGKIFALPPSAIAPLEHIKQLKQLAINSNWDATYIFYRLHLLDKMNPPLDDFIEYIGNIKGRAVLHKLDDFAKKFTREISQPNLQWSQLQQEFQKLHQNYLSTGGGSDYANNSEILGEKQELRQFLQALVKAGFMLGTATGRPYEEARFALQQADCLQYFHQPSFITYKNVEEAEAEFPHSPPLGKPHPFTILKAIYESEISQKEFAKHTDAINRLYLHNPDVIFIGDAESDKQAAKFAGTKFLMV